MSGEFSMQPFSESDRRGVFTGKAIPAVDLGRADVVQQVIKASKEYSFFQVINHGINEATILNMASVAKEFFDLPAEDKEYYNLWPSKPTKYREVVRTYSAEARKLGLKLLKLISEGLGVESGYFDRELSQGLGVESGYFDKELSQGLLMTINYYAPCLDPTHTLGLPKHCDPNVLTLLFQGDVSGLQVFKDGELIDVNPLPNVLVVNLGLMLEIVLFKAYRFLSYLF
ncbi:hypothetical protein GIB67_015314 [Kingdonia uniflora]|uniref:Fe2OG dioxygenase domain-containing protein n=1 Tax=Kingdonia uniflora TaxID=39325 RepID=A0A7J7KYL9_9MAGN|nr:hypothetical protein GIB67_015314 [Kingdonia uniflora]